MLLLAFFKRMYATKYNSRKYEEEDLWKREKRSGEVGVRKIHRRYKWNDTNNNTDLAKYSLSHRGRISCSLTTSTIGCIHLALT